MAKPFQSNHNGIETQISSRWLNAYIVLFQSNHNGIETFMSVSQSNDLSVFQSNHNGIETCHDFCVF